MRNRKGIDPDVMKRRKELDGVEGGESIIRAYYVRKILFSVKGKKRDK